MIRILLLLGAVLLAVWAWRSGRGQTQQEQVRRKPPATPLQEMATCPRCGVHFPRTEGVAGQAGLYCGAEHKRAAEG